MLSCTCLTVPSPVTVLKVVQFGAPRSVLNSRTYEQPVSVANDRFTCEPLRTTVSVGEAALNTTTLKAQALVLPLASLAVHVTVFVPSANIEPEAGTHVTVGAGSQLSVAPGF